MDLPMIIKLKELEQENSRLKKMYAEERLNLRFSRKYWKKVVKPSQRREMARIAVQNKSISVQMACEIFSISRCCFKYKSKLSDENELMAD